MSGHAENTVAGTIVWQIRSAAEAAFAEPQPPPIPLEPPTPQPSM
jgi:hypothetical protein